MLCILVHSSLQRVAHIHVILQSSSAWRVSMLKPQHGLLITNNQASHPSLKACIFKENHLISGDCILADHYFSPVQGCLPHTFGKECRYTRGSLFVDHANGKIFNFPQYSNTTHEMLQGISWLKAMAQEEGFKKSYHPNNGSLPLPMSKPIVSSLSKHSFLVVLALNIRTALLCATSKPLHNGLALTCFV